MKAMLEAVQAARKAEREQQQQQQPGMDTLLQQMAQLEAQVDQLQQDKQQLLQQQQQHPSSTAEGQEELSSIKQQLSSSRRKVQQLVQARDKLEIILHDFEAAAAEEKQQLETQLSAANQAARKAAIELSDVEEQLALAQQRLAEASEQQHHLQQQLDEQQQQLQAQQQQLEARQVEAEAAAAAAAAAATAKTAAPVGSELQVGTRHDQSHRHRAHKQQSSTVTSSRSSHSAATKDYALCLQAGRPGCNVCLSLIFTTTWVHLVGGRMGGASIS
jgi:chromosome segregation ATPase